MSNQNRVQRRRFLKEAEGYLELATLFDDHNALEQAHKTMLADRCLHVLNLIEISANKDRGARRSRVLYLRGQAHRLAERFEEAAEVLEASWDADRTNIHTCFALGWCYKRLGQLGLAVEALQNAVTIDRSSGIAHYNLACYLALSNQAKMAVIHLSTAIEIDPNFRSMAYEEPDFDSIRTDPEFQQIATVIV